MAVRIALGAEPRRILGLVLTEGLRLVVVGVAMGTIAAWALSGTLAGFVYGIRTTDPASFAIGIVTIVAVTLAACLIPARRAASINPSHVLRQ
jgi:putative ABC transport system permease protein